MPKINLPTPQDIEKKLQSKLKLEGVEIEGVMCSVTKEDMWGLSAVRAYILSGGVVDFDFDNGNQLQLTSDNLESFESIWVPFRASFFNSN